MMARGAFVGDVRAGDSQAAALLDVSRMNPPTLDQCVAVQFVSENLRMKKNRQSPNEIMSERDVSVWKHCHTHSLQRKIIVLIICHVSRLAGVKS